MSFDRLGLRAELLKAVKSKGYTAPTSIQERVIPAIFAGEDIFARSQTGTGKTDAFALPLVDILSRQPGNRRRPRALILTPTRELALQVGESIKAYARRVSIRCTVVYGGVNIHPQIDRLKRGIDVLVATPGRLLDLAEHRGLNLSEIEFLIFDEADRMLDLGFSEEISEIRDLVPAHPRILLFSATYTRQIRDLAERILQHPRYIEVTPGQKAADPIVQRMHLVDRHEKRGLLAHLITQGRWSQVLVFVRTKFGANKLALKLGEQGISAAALHGNKSQSFRTRTLKEFKDNEIRCLVATDVAARGLDITNLPYVVNYDMPGVPEDYIHRIGRTGRAGVSGIAVSLVSPDEKPILKTIEHLLGQKIPQEEVEGYTMGGAVPDFVLLRPGNTASEKKADRTVRDLVEERDAKRQGSKPGAGKPSARSGGKSDPKSGAGSGTRSGSGRPKQKTGSKKRAGKKQSRSRTRFQKISQKTGPSGPGKPKGKRRR